MGTEPARLVVVGEDRRTYDLLTALADRRIAQRLPWVRDGSVPIEGAREWVPRTSDRAWHMESELAAECRLRIHARGKSDHFIRLRKVLLALLELKVDAVILSHDDDHVAERRPDYESVLVEHPPPYALALALPKPEIEAWCLALVRDAAALARAQALKSTIGFNPTVEPHRLTSTVKGAPRRQCRMWASRLRTGSRSRARSRVRRRGDRPVRSCQAVRDSGRGATSGEGCA